MSPKTEQDSIYYNNTQANKTSRGVKFCQDMLFFGINLDPGVFHLVRHISFSVGTPWRCWTRKPRMNRSKRNYLTRHVCWSLVACSPTLPESNSSALPKQTNLSHKFSVSTLRIADPPRPIRFPISVNLTPDSGGRSFCAYMDFHTLCVTDLVTQMTQ